MRQLKKDGAIWKISVTIRFVLYAILFLVIVALRIAGASEASQAQVSSVYQRFYFENGLKMPPNRCISYTWTHMEKGDCVQFAVKGDGTLIVGISPMSGGEKLGVKHSGTFSASIIVPSTGYYKVFLLNSSSDTIFISGVALCSRSRMMETGENTG